MSREIRLGHKTGKQSGDYLTLHAYGSVYRGSMSEGTAMVALQQWLDRKPTPEEVAKILAETWKSGKGLGECQEIRYNDTCVFLIVVPGIGKLKSFSCEGIPVHFRVAGRMSKSLRDTKILHVESR